MGWLWSEIVSPFWSFVVASWDWSEFFAAVWGFVVMYLAVMMSFRWIKRAFFDREESSADGWQFCAYCGDDIGSESHFGHPDCPVFRAEFGDREDGRPWDY